MFKLLFQICMFGRVVSEPQMKQNRRTKEKGKRGENMNNSKVNVPISFLVRKLFPLLLLLLPLRDEDLEVEEC